MALLDVCARSSAREPFACSTLQRSAMAAIPYIGSRISLISKSEIRYEGTLYTIDTAESTVALQNGKPRPLVQPCAALFGVLLTLASTVRLFGTEDRHPEGGGFVAASPEVYEYIIFRGSDIKDLHVIETQPAPVMQDPSIMQVCRSFLRLSSALVVCTCPYSCTGSVQMVRCSH